VKNWLWFSDFFSSSEVHLHGFTEHLLEKTTRFQDIDIVDTPFFGRMLIIDGDVQSSEKNSFITKPWFIQPCYSTRIQVLKHKTVEELYMVDIDEDMIAAAREFLISWHQGAFDDPRMHLIFISDLTEPFEMGPSFPLFTKQFAQVVYDKLDDQGVYVVQSSIFSLW